nr:hypothetical protein [Citrobacter portucalensis]
MPGNRNVAGTQPLNHSLTALHHGQLTENNNGINTRGNSTEK